MADCSKLLIFKFVELLLAAGCLALHYYSLERDINTHMLITATFGAYIVILVGALVAALLREPLPKRAWIVYCLVGAGLFAACGALTIHYYTNDTLESFVAKFESWEDEQLFKKTKKNYGFVKGGLAITNAFLFFVDAVLTFCAKPSG